MQNQIAPYDYGFRIISDTQRVYYDKNYEITYNKTKLLDGTHRVKISIKNIGSEVIEDWSLFYDFCGTVVSPIYSQVVNGADGFAYIKNIGYNGSIAPGGSQSFEYILTNATVDFPDSFWLVQSRQERNKSDFSASLNITSGWGTNINGAVTLTNTSDTPIEWWELDFASNFKITASYSAGIQVIETPAGYKLKGTNSKTLAPGANIQLSFAGTIVNSSVIPAISECSASGVAVDAEEFMSRDSDGDGLPDIYEWGLGTNKYNPDTDGDGLTDGEEVNYRGTNPLLSDSDWDGIPDGEDTVSQTITRTLTGGDGSITEVSLTANSNDTLENLLTVKSAKNTDPLASEAVGLIGEPINFSLADGAAFDGDAKISFKLNPEKSFEDLVFIWHNEETNQLYELETSYNSTTRTAVAAAPQLGNVLLADAATWQESYRKSMVYDESFYEVFTHSELTWDEAKSFCEDKGGHLVTISSQEEQEFLLRLVAGNIDTDYTYWLGYRFIDDYPDDGEDPYWESINGEGMPYTNWAPGEPNGLPNEAVAQMYNKYSMAHAGADMLRGQWNDTLSKQDFTLDYSYLNAGVICEFDTKQDADEDNDGIPDRLEIAGMVTKSGRVIFTDPTEPDSDFDGIKDGDEINIVPASVKKTAYLNQGQEYLFDEPTACVLQSNGKLKGEITVVYFDFKLNSNGKELDPLKYNVDFDKDTDKDGLMDWEELCPYLMPNADKIDFLRNEDGSLKIRKLYDYVNGNAVLVSNPSTENILFYVSDPFDMDGDSDNDGISDYDEVHNRQYGTVYYGITNPMSADTDGDGLTDAEEFLLGTNPTVKDTDGDGIIDSLDSDPLNPNVGDATVQKNINYDTEFFTVTATVNASASEISQVGSVEKLLRLRETSSAISENLAVVGKPISIEYLGKGAVSFSAIFTPKQSGNYVLSKSNGADIWDIDSFTVDSVGTYAIIDKDIRDKKLTLQEKATKILNGENPFTDGTVLLPKNKLQEFGGHNYLLIDTELQSGYFTWDEANEFAKSLGGHLATINSQPEQDFINGLKFNPTWLGGVRNDINSPWCWVTGEPFSEEYATVNVDTGIKGIYERETSIVVQNPTTGEWEEIGKNNTTKLVVMESDGKWFARESEKQTNGFIIEWDGDIPNLEAGMFISSITKQPIFLPESWDDGTKNSNGKYQIHLTEETLGELDTDDDGLSDWEELNLDSTGLEWNTDKSAIIGFTNSYPINGTEYSIIPLMSDFTMPDTDFDGLLDGEEVYFYGTDVLNSDTDGDGLSDGLEVELWFDPLDINPDGDSYDDYEEWEQDKDPYLYDMTAADYAIDYAKGLAAGDFIESTSIAMMAGQLTLGLMSLIPEPTCIIIGTIADIRDVAGSIWRGDWISAGANALGLIPGVGDAIGIAIEIPVKMGLFIFRKATDIASTGIAILKHVDNVLPDIAAKFLKNADYGAKYLDEVATTPKITKVNYEFADDLAQAAGKSLDEIISVGKKTLDDILSNKIFTNSTGRVDNYTSTTKGFSAAKSDFYDMPLFNIKEYDTGAIVGHMPDGRTVIVRPHSSKYRSGDVPTLEIQGPVNKNIKIRY